MFALKEIKSISEENNKGANSSLCLYLSARHIKSSQETLLEFYPPETKVIVGFRVSWDDGWTSLIELKDMEKFSIEKNLMQVKLL